MVIEDPTQSPNRSPGRPSAPITTLEDHEDGALNYDGDTGSWSNDADSSLEGSRLISSSASGANIGHSSATVSRGNKYKCRIVPNGSSGEIWFNVGVQDSTSPIADCYTIQVEVNGDDFILQKRTSSGNSLLASDVNVSGGIASGTEYRVVFEYGDTNTSDNIVATLLDSGDTEKASISATDDAHTGGTFGFRSHEGTGHKADFITEESL